MCGIASMLIGFYSLTLPTTPPIGHTGNQRLATSWGSRR